METAVKAAAARMRPMFSGLEFNASTKTHGAAKQPVTPNAACASTITSRVEICKANTIKVAPEDPSD